MNRIRELREARGMSADELGALINTSGTQVRRLETGARRLTVDWMQRIARALNVEPAELLAPTLLASLEDDVEPADLSQKPLVALAMQGTSRQVWRVRSSVVERCGIAAGDMIVADTSPAAIAAIATGDIVVAETVDIRQLGEVRTILRQFVAPSMLITNQTGDNPAPLDSERVDFTIIAVVIPKR